MSPMVTLMKRTRGYILPVIILLLFMLNENLGPFIDNAPVDNGLVTKIDMAIDGELLNKTRYSNQILEDFDNWDNINPKRTDCLIDTKAGRAVFWGSRPLWPAQYTGSMGLYTRSHGGGYSPKYDEYWYPHWAGSTIYRYNRNGNQIGSFNTGQNQMMQVWGDRDGTYYTANWGSNTITRRSDMGSGTIWTYWIGTTAGAVCCDDNYVYALGWCQTSIHILNKNNGQRIRQYNLQGSTRCYGSLAYANGLLYVGGYNNDYSRVGIVNAQTGDYIGDFRVQENIYNMAYNGEEYLISSNGHTVYKYKISNGNSYVGTGAQPPTTVSHVQSKVLYSEWPTVGAFKITSYEYKPQGTNIRYNVSSNGKNWVTVANNTTYYPPDKFSYMMWNATITTENDQVRPYIDRIFVEFDLVETPIPYGPNSSMWQGSRTPTLVWNFTDPDEGDHQSDYLVEIFNDSNMENLVYNSSWVNSTDPQHTVREDLDDGAYYWRVKTKDSMHAASNYSGLKKIMIDVTKPLGHIIIEEGAFSVNEQLVDLEIYAMDNTSGMVDMQIIRDSGVVGPWEEYTTKKRIVLSPIDGMKTIGVRFRDTAGIISDTFNDTVYLDLLAPVPINITSPTHPDPEVYYNSIEPVFRWDPPYEVTGIKGYSYTLDTSPRLEPGKVVYSLNGDITDTVPGEFPGLIDGSWYFHIACCDVYDQWGNTSHFQINIDSTDPVILELTPDNDPWYNVSSIRTGVVFEDMDGFGLDLSSIQYSYKKADGTFTPWTEDALRIEVMETGIKNNPRKVRAGVDLGLVEGVGNSIRWQVTDISGNGPVFSRKHDFKADFTNVIFIDPVPEGSEISNEDTVPCGITISDGEGSGVDGKTVQYGISHWGSEPGYFINWTPINNNNVIGTMEVLMTIPFDPGKDNYIKWRAKDAVGNGYQESDTYRVWVNSPPIPEIYFPYDEEEIKGGEVVLNATGTYDNEGDELAYYWEIKNGTSKKRVFSASGIKAVANLEEAGKYLVYLFVDDGYGFNVSTRVDIYFTPKMPVIVNPNGMDEPGEKEGEDESIYTRWKWHMVGVGCLLLLLILVIIVTSKKRRGNEKGEDETPKPIPRSERPYPVGTRDFHHPQYSEMYRTYQQSPPISRYPTSSMSNTGGGMQNMGFGTQSGGTTIAMGYPPWQPRLEANNPPLAERPALPMYTETGTHAPPPSEMSVQQQVVSPPSPSGHGPIDVAQYPQPVSSPPTTPQAEPTYALPTFSSDEGIQNLNLMALPPARVEEAPVPFSQEPTPQSFSPTVEVQLSPATIGPSQIQHSFDPSVQAQSHRPIETLHREMTTSAPMETPTPRHSPEPAVATPAPVQTPLQVSVPPSVFPSQEYIPPDRSALQGPEHVPFAAYPSTPVEASFDMTPVPRSSVESSVFPIDQTSQARSEMVRGMSLFARLYDARDPSSPPETTPRPEPITTPPTEQETPPAARSPPPHRETDAPPPPLSPPEKQGDRGNKKMLDDIFGGGP